MCLCQMGMSTVQNFPFLAVLPTETVKSSFPTLTKLGNVHLCFLLPFVNKTRVFTADVFAGTTQLLSYFVGQLASLVVNEQCNRRLI